MAAHVTSWGKQPLKFRTDVASMCKLGFDIRTHEMNENDLAYCKEAVLNFNRLQDAILEGEQYRLYSPYEGDHAAMMYTDVDQNKGVVFAFDMHPRFNDKTRPVKLQGLKPDVQYTMKKINLMPGRPSRLSFDGKTYSGAYLMHG